MQGDINKRNELTKDYSNVEDCLRRFDDTAISVLNTYFEDRDIFEVLNEKRGRLEKGDYHVLVAGNNRSSNLAATASRFLQDNTFSFMFA